MPQTKRRRKTKHRGNAAGVIEARGRTGRKPTSSEKKGSPRSRGQAPVKKDRFDKPPTWKGSFYRSLAAAGIMLVIILLLKQPAKSIVLFPIVLILYVPVSYYTDLWLYRRRQRQKAAGKARSR